MKLSSDFLSLSSVLCGFLFMSFWLRLSLVSIVVLSFHAAQPVFAGGKTYQGSGHQLTAPFGQI